MNRSNNRNQIIILWTSFCKTGVFLPNLGTWSTILRDLIPDMDTNNLKSAIILLTFVLNNVVNIPILGI